MSRLVKSTAVVTCVLAGVGTVSAALPDPVRTDKGLVSGTPVPSADVHVFKGIPFAAAPLGQRRWREPQAMPAWEGVRKAEQFGPRCMQPAGNIGGRALGESDDQPVSEDCLYLNVWTPAASASERRPVIVRSHGGAALARKGVVFVSYNYRLGVFGFFAHPQLTAESERGASGNYALMDFVAALEWVQRNGRLPLPSSSAEFCAQTNRVLLTARGIGNPARMIRAISARLLR